MFAFAITLLVLNLYDPTNRGSNLVSGLIGEWPAFFAFVISFLQILVMWINHHNMFNYIARLSREFMLLNGLLLLFVVLTPFTTALVADNLLLADANVAAAIYCGSFFAVAVVWNITWHNASHHHGLIYEDTPQSQIKKIKHEYSIAPIAYGISVIVALALPIFSVVLVAIVGTYFGITVTGGERSPEDSP